MPREEVVLALPGDGRRDRVPPTTHVKGTWLASSLRGLRERGHAADYLAQLPTEYHPIVLGSVTSDWHPLDVLLAHYAACERLDLHGDEIVAIGRATTQHAQGSALGVTARLVTSGGMTPWTLFPQFQRFWDRMIRGGGLGVWKLGPKEARVEIASFAGCRFRYCRIGLCGVVESAVSLLCAKAYVTEMTAFTTPDAMAMRVSWA